MGLGLALDVSWQPEYIWNNTEPITYTSVRRASLGGNIHWPVATAVRQAMSLADSGNATGGVLLVADCKWFIPARQLGAPAPAGIVPKPGDLIRLNSSLEIYSWTVLKTAYEPFDQVYELDSRNLSIALDMADIIDILSPLNRQDVALGRRPIMAPKYSAVRCRIQEVSQTTELLHGRRSAVKSFLVFTTERLDVTEEDQIVDKTGGKILRVVGFTNPDRLDEPQVIQAEWVP